MQRDLNNFCSPGKIAIVNGAFSLILGRVGGMHGITVSHTRHDPDLLRPVLPAEVVLHFNHVLLLGVSAHTCADTAGASYRGTSAIQWALRACVLTCPDPA